METDDTNASPTGAAAPATDDKSKSPATPKQPTGADKSGPADEKVTLNKADYDNLVSQRDKNFSEAEAAKERADNAQSWVEQKQEQEAKGKVVDQFLADEGNRKKYPNVTKDDLMLAGSPDDIEAVATRVEAVHATAEQSALERLQAADYPKQLSPDEAAKELDALDGASDPDAFDKAVDIQANTSSEESKEQ